MKSFRPWDPEQKWLLPPSVDELVPEGDLAHFVRDTVLQMDLSTILDAYQDERGYPPYDPRMMTALLLYGYCRGIYSSRRVAQACERDTGFMAVTALQYPDFRTISEFRRRHLEALKGLFRQVLRLCERAGLTRLGHVALDGTKVKANASKHKAMSYDRMAEKEKRLKKEIREWFAESDRIDAEEDRQHGATRRGDEPPEWMKSKQERLAKIRAAKRALEEEARQKAEEAARAAGKSDKEIEEAGKEAKPAPKAQRNFTDAESRIMKGSDAFVQAYNCQAAVDDVCQVIVAQRVTNEATDVRQLKPILAEMKTNTGRNATEISADAGYCSEENLRELKRRNIRGYVATGKDSHSDGRAKGRNRSQKPCRKEMARRLRIGGFHSRYRKRKTLIEPVFGQIKQARGFRQFLLRGLEKVAGEWSLLATAHNLLKLFTWAPQPA